MRPHLRPAFLILSVAAAIALASCRSSEPRDPFNVPGAIPLNDSFAGKAGGEGFDTVSNVAVQPTDSFLSYEAPPDAVRLFWKDSASRVLGSLGAARRFSESCGDTLRFLMNAGMYTEDQSPLGLFIQEGDKRRSLNRDTGYGNFYLRPNGVFFVTKAGKAGVCRTQDFSKKKDVYWATQSGPMLLIDGGMHPAFKKGSINVNIRNGVGILPDGHVLMAISTVPVSFWDFAEFFKRRGCVNALYLDGAVSRAWYPEGGLNDNSGAFGIIVGAVANDRK